MGERERVTETKRENLRVIKQEGKESHWGGGGEIRSKGDRVRKRYRKREIQSANDIRETECAR